MDKKSLKVNEEKEREEPANVPMRSVFFDVDRLSDISSIKIVADGRLVEARRG